MIEVLKINDSCCVACLSKQEVYKILAGKGGGKAGIHLCKKCLKEVNKQIASDFY